jgi:hypothetical protein
MSSAFYIFRLVWPFLKEMVLGGVTLKEGVRTQKKKVILLFFISAMTITLFLIIPRFYQLSQDHMKLEKSIDVANVHRLEDRIKQLEAENSKKPAVLEVASCEKPKEPKADTQVQKATSSTITKVHVNPLPQPALPQTEGKPDRKKSYIDFFDQYDD